MADTSSLHRNLIYIFSIFFPLHGREKTIAGKGRQWPSKMALHAKKIKTNNSVRQKNNKRCQKKRNKISLCSVGKNLAGNTWQQWCLWHAQIRCCCWPPLSWLIAGWFLLLLAVALAALAHHCQSPWCFCLRGCNCCLLLAVAIDHRFSSSFFLWLISMTVNVTATTLPLRHDAVAATLMVCCPKTMKKQQSVLWGNK